MMKNTLRTALAALVGLFVVVSAGAADKKPIRIGVIFDYTGAFAGGGSKAAAIGTRIAIDLINEAGGVEGHMIEAIHADAQSKADVAINEATRLLDQENVDLIMGVYSSGHCVPMAQKVDAQKRFMWANVCISSAVFKGRNLKYVFRAQVHSDQFGWASCTFLNEVAKEKLGMEPGDLKVAIIHEDGPYGVLGAGAVRAQGVRGWCVHAGRIARAFVTGKDGCQSQDSQDWGILALARKLPSTGQKG